MFLRKRGGGERQREKDTAKVGSRDRRRNWAQQQQQQQQHPTSNNGGGHAEWKPSRNMHSLRTRFSHVRGAGLLARVGDY